MSKYDNFQSQNELQSQRDEVQVARKQVLEKAKAKYEKEERRREKAKKQGEGSWMLDAVSQRINKEERAIEKAKKEKKKKKKEKKKKKKRKKEKSASDSSSSSNESDEEKWVDAKSSENSTSVISSKVKGPQLQRESWMETPLDLFPSISRQEIRDAVQKKKDESRKEAEKLLAPGQHTRELNPYWKDGGTGLPEEIKQTQVSKSLSASSIAGDGGLSWLNKALQRCKEQAKEEGRSLEEIAAERYGSLSHLKSLIGDAEKALNTSSNRNDRRDKGYRREEGIESRRGQDKERPSERRLHEDDSKDTKGYFKRGSYRDRDSDEKGNYHHRDYKNESKSDRDREKKGIENERRASRGHFEEDKERIRSADKDKRRSPTSDRRPTFRHPQSDDDEEGPIKKPVISSSRFRKPCDDEDRDAGVSRRRFMKPDELSSARQRDRKFQKPGELDDGSLSSRSPSTGPSRSRNSESSRSTERESSWRKKSDDVPKWKKASHSSDEQDRKGERDKSKKSSDRRSRKVSTSSSSSSSSHSDSNEEEDDKKKEESNKEEQSSDGETESPSAPVKILSEEELNDLAAKILRAEIMGDATVATELKNKLENARQTREASKSGGEGADFSHARRTVKSRKGREEENMDDENVVVLSRTNKAGMVRPVLGESDEFGPSGGRKRKKKNVQTHGEQGERKQFFHDDDKFDLKTLVEREKAGTAEDQNSMFARLAGRAGDRDLDVDDMFVSKAARNQEEAQASNRDKMAAIFEHRKINSAMEKCQRCFNKIPKHLIIAIGTKAYLCLPPHRSLTDGHCLIVPMSHVSSATSMDEDVWQEIQLFRKSLVQMFTSQDQDVVIMETVMHLKHFPHTAIECIPMEREVGDLAPIYFKKAIQDAGPEWSDNKKLHDLSKKDVRHVIPKGFPYFSVDFGLQGGFAHVIEDEVKFTNYFGREIVGGMLDAEPSLWRKPQKQSFEDQRLKVLQFEKLWSPFDWTRELNKDD